MKLINADNLCERIKTEMNPYGAPTLDYQSGLRILRWIDNAPNFELTRCIDCKYSKIHPVKMRGLDYEWLICNYHNEKAVDERDFCSWGERKEKVEYENAEGITSEHFRIGYEKGLRDGYAKAITEMGKGKKNETN